MKKSVPLVRSFVYELVWKKIGKIDGIKMRDKKYESLFLLTQRFPI